MKIFISIVFNAIILYVLSYLLSGTENLVDGIIVAGWWKTYVIWGIILWGINVFIKPVIKIISLPFFFLFLWLTSIVINGVILYLLDFFINDILQIPGVSYSINWIINFIIAVAIFSILNIFYSILISKK